MNKVDAHTGASTQPALLRFYDIAYIACSYTRGSMIIEDVSKQQFIQILSAYSRAVYNFVYTHTHTHR